MNAQRFDQLSRRLSWGIPRREAIALAAGVLAATFIDRDREAEAGCKKVGNKCDKNKDCCDDARCQGKKCKCKSGFTECGGKCFDLDKTENHCGSCNTNCVAGESCVAGACVEGGCTKALDSCAPAASCIPCPNRPDAVCYTDNGGQSRCSRFLLCVACETDLDCEDFGANARCIVCAGQCSGTACAAG